MFAKLLELVPDIEIYLHPVVDVCTGINDIKMMCGVSLQRLLCRMTRIMTS